MEHFLYKYKVTYYDVDGRLQTEIGFILGSKLSEMVARLENYYGVDELDSIENLTFVSDEVDNGLIPINTIREAMGLEVED